MTKRLLAAFVIAFSTTPAVADIIVDQAMITGGELRVTGRLSRPRQTSVTLDGEHQTKSDANGRFAFRLTYHPASCVVALQADDEQRQAVVGFCGQRGPEAPNGASTTTSNEQPGAVASV